MLQVRVHFAAVVPLHTLLILRSYTFLLSSFLVFMVYIHLRYTMPLRACVGEVALIGLTHDIQIYRSKANLAS